MNMQGKYCYEYPHAAMTADCVIFGFDGRELKVLLIERGLPPHKGMWALPGGFMRIDETIETTANRELFEETGLTHIYMTQFRVYSEVNRDPRERVVTVAFIALVRPDDYRLIAGDDAADARWFRADMLPPMAFDHARIVAEAREHLSETLRIKPVAFELLNKTFTMSELQRVYEAINNTTYDRRNFTRKALQTGMIQEIEPQTGSFDECNNPTFARFPLNERSSMPKEDIRNGTSAPRARSKRKFFSWRPRPKDKNKDDDSIKDIFNF